MCPPHGSTPDAHPDALLALDTRLRGDAVIVTAVGEIDLVSAPELGVALRAALALPG